MDLRERKLRATCGEEGEVLYSYFFYWHLSNLLVIKTFEPNKMSKKLLRYIFSAPGFEEEFKQRIAGFTENLNLYDTEIRVKDINRIYRKVTTIFHKFPQLTIDVLNLGFKRVYCSESVEDDLRNYKRDEILIPLLNLAIETNDLELAQFLIKSKDKTSLVLLAGQQYDENYPLYLLLRKYLQNVIVTEELGKKGLADENDELGNAQAFLEVIGVLIRDINATIAAAHKKAPEIYDAKSIYDDVFTKLIEDHPEFKDKEKQQKEIYQCAFYSASRVEEKKEEDDEKKESDHINEEVKKLYGFNMMARYFAIPTILLTVHVVASSLLFGYVGGIAVGITAVFCEVLYGKAVYDNDLYFACAFEQFAQDSISCFGNPSHVAELEMRRNTEERSFAMVGS